VRVDILTFKLKKGRVMLELVTRILAMALFIVITWNLVEMGQSFFATKDGTLTIGIPFYPVAYSLALCTFVQCFAIAVQMVKVWSTRRVA
jgi:TRAP-type C4-dicarboxylate transport system permease small subunit